MRPIFAKKSSQARLAKIPVNHLYTGAYNQQRLSARGVEASNSDRAWPQPKNLRLQIAQTLENINRGLEIQVAQLSGGGSGNNTM